VTGLRVIYITTDDGVIHAFAFLVESEGAEPLDDRETVLVFESCDYVGREEVVVN
jgi:hypothetical protein